MHSIDPETEPEPTKAPQPEPTKPTEAPEPTEAPTKERPTEAPTKERPTEAPTKERPTEAPTKERPTEAPTKERPTEAPTKERPTEAPTKERPTEAPTKERPTEAPTKERPTEAPTTERPTTAPAPAYLYISTLPKTSYFIGDQLETAGLKLILTYSDGMEESVSSGYSVSTPSLTSAGSQQIMVGYKGLYTSYTITIKTPTIAIIGGTTGGASTQLSAQTNPANQKIYWSSSNPAIAEVNNGCVTVKKAGTVEITAAFIYNNKSYSDTRKLTVGYSQWSKLGDFRFAKEATSDLKREVPYGAYCWYQFECPGCHLHSAWWNVACSTCRTYIPFSGVHEVYAPIPFTQAVQLSDGKRVSWLSGDVLIKDVNNQFTTETVSSYVAYVHHSQAVIPAYRYQTRSFIIERID